MTCRGVVFVSVQVNRNDGDNSGTLWKLDIYNDQFDEVEYSTTYQDFYHPWGLAVGPTGRVYVLVEQTVFNICAFARSSSHIVCAES